jgi:hypothetical protein
MPGPAGAKASAGLFSSWRLVFIGRSLTHAAKSGIFTGFRASPGEGRPAARSEGGWIA